MKHILYCFLLTICTTLRVGAAMYPVAISGSDFIQGSAALWRTTPAAVTNQSNQYFFGEMNSRQLELIYVGRIYQVGIPNQVVTEVFFMDSDYPIKFIELVDQSRNQTGGKLRHINGGINELYLHLEMESSFVGGSIEYLVGIYGEIPQTDQVNWGEITENSILDAGITLKSRQSQTEGDSLHLCYTSSMNFTRIEAIDVSADRSGGKIHIVDGGIGYKSVCLNAVPIIPGSSINIYVVFYGEELNYGCGNFRLGHFRPGLVFLNTITQFVKAAGNQIVKDRIEFEGDTPIAFVQGIDRTRCGSNILRNITNGVNAKSIQVDFESIEGTDIHYTLLIWGVNFKTYMNKSL